MISPKLAAGVAFVLASFSLNAAVIGRNPPALLVTAERIAALPAAEQPAWKDYLARSERLRAADQAAFAAELKANHLETSTVPLEGRGSGLALDRPAEWYATDEARQIADNVISFQTPAGGWSKNLNFAHHARQPGERFAAANAGPAAAKPDDYDFPHDPAWHYVGTFDNDATITQLRFLARLVTALGPEKGEVYRRAFLRGFDYVLAAQYPNGGWPQVYPLEGGYHDAITFNDNALVNDIQLLRDIAAGQGDFAFVPAEGKKRAAASEQRGLACILSCQLSEKGQRTAWSQQCDALTLVPVSGRNYEMPSQSGGETAGVMIFLMSLRDPQPAVVAAVHAAAAWCRKTAIEHVVYRAAPDGSGRALLPDPKGGPLWARYYEIGTDRPLFGDRDKSIHDDVSELSKERRNGYAWYGNGPAKALAQYEAWAEKHPAQRGN